MKITLDGTESTASGEETILDVARRQGIEIPTLCHSEPCSGAPSTSCLVCLVKLDGRFIPACATKVQNGMVVESETDEVRQLRRTALELLLSDHLGDCSAPCQFGCPAKLDIPKMLRQIRAGKPLDALRTIKETIALPAVLGRICPKPCEKICRRKDLDGAIGICAMKKFAADTDLAQEIPYRPEIAPSIGKRVLVIGAGPSGLAATFYLARFGHRVALYAMGKKPGGRLRNMPESELPESVLDAEIRTILSLPIDYYPEEKLDWTEPDAMPEIRRSFDAVLLCCGPSDPEVLKQSGFEISGGRLTVDQGSYTTSQSGIFAAGTVFRAKSSMVVRSVADGREAAESIDRFLRTGHVSLPEPVFSVKLGKLNSEELRNWAEINLNADQPRNSDQDDAQKESARCLHCDCRGKDYCRLLKHSAAYRAETGRFAQQPRRTLTIKRSGNVIFEPGKCIKCGLCVAVARQHGEKLGLAFLGRGFDVRLGVPFDQPMLDALQKSAAEAVAACPTAALTLAQTE